MERKSKMVYQWSICCIGKIPWIHRTNFKTHWKKSTSERLQGLHAKSIIFVYTSSKQMNNEKNLKTILFTLALDFLEL